VGKIEYVEKTKQEIDLVEPLWEKLTEHHKARSQHFKHLYDQYKWEGRKNELLGKSKNGALRIDLAKDGDTGKYIGYCVSTVSENKTGEIESIYIESEYRKQGIGDHFMKKALKWMDGHAVERRVIAVAAGNEEAFGFYSRYGFYPRVSILIRAETKE
jgi:ribosomal protein S18 acetylase RimI-like enzyme